MPKRLKRLQNVWYEKVVSRLRDHFVTETGRVIEGNYDVGEMAPIIFDRRFRTYLPAYKEKVHHTVPEPLTKLDQVRRKIGGLCNIVLFDVPEHVAPMRYPGEIKEGEQEGIDYFKTYYSVDRSKCPLCEDEVEWEFTFNFETQEQIDYYDSEPNNHCVVSQDGGCSGEIIEQGEDEGGTYIIWKAYTEGTNHNRSGLGYVRFRATLKNRSTHAVVCKFDAIVGVDCCEKTGLLQPEIYWECWQLADCTEFIWYGGTKLTEVPSLMGISVLSWYASGEGGNAARFYALPEVGGCLPYDWSLEGIGTIEVADSFGRMAIFRFAGQEIDCNSRALIRAQDRCGGEDFFIAQSCCETVITEVSIGYTSLSMQCGASQTFTPSGGCGPYEWSLGGGGTLEPNEDGTATYTAPNSNENCANNATVTATDCCGSSASVQIAVNCNTGTGPAYSVYHWYDLGQDGGCNADGRSRWSLIGNSYRCDGVFLAECCSRTYCVCDDNPGDGPPICQQGGTGEDYCGGPPYGDWGCHWGQMASVVYCTYDIPSVHQLPREGESWDQRTEAMKEAGCCPLNPYTGLPF